jgi:hypothetical protein
VLGAGPSRHYTTFTRELRAGDGFHMLSAAVAGNDENSLRIGHRVVDSASAQTVSWVMETLPLPVSATPQLRHRLEARASAWPGPEVPQAVAYGPTQGALTGRDRGEAAGSWQADDVARRQVHRFSAAGMQSFSRSA